MAKKGSSSYKEYYRDIRAKGIQKTDYAKKQRKYEETCLKKYGVRNYSQTKMHKDDMKKFFSSKAYNVGGKIIFENICFDSSWELQLFLFLRDFKIEFIFHPKKYFSYKDKNGNQHLYFPDFLIEGNFYEIKGNQFFDENGNPSGSKKFWIHDWTEKYQCMIENHVTILRENDLKPIFKYFNEKYGSDYWRKFTKNHLAS